MKRIAGIFLVSVYMLTFAEFHNLLKLPVLVTHFKEHRQLDPSISFWSFLKLHYEEPIVVDDDYQRDRQLPFQDTDCGPISATNICECLHTVIGINKPSDLPRVFSLYREQNKSRLSPYDIFQPPRCA